MIGYLLGYISNQVQLEVTNLRYMPRYMMYPSYPPSIIYPTSFWKKFHQVKTWLGVPDVLGTSRQMARWGVTKSRQGVTKIRYIVGYMDRYLPPRKIKITLHFKSNLCRSKIPASFGIFLYKREANMKGENLNGCLPTYVPPRKGSRRLPSVGNTVP